MGICGSLLVRNIRRGIFAGVGVAGYVIETGETINLSNAKISEIYEESVDGFINDDDICAMLCKPITFELTKGEFANRI